MKKTLTIILSMLLVLMLSVGAMAADSDFKHMPDYFAVGKYTNSGAAEVVIPEKLNGEGTPVLYADSLGMNGLKGVTTLTISKGVTHIGDQNVMSGKDLTKISLPDTLEVIGRRNFYQMDALTEVIVPGNVAYVGSDSFSSCKARRRSPSRASARRSATTCSRMRLRIWSFMSLPARLTLTRRRSLRG